MAEQLQEIDCFNSRIILEPAGRNTAPAVALAAQHVLQNEPDGMLLVLAADHLITQLGAFHDALNKAIEFSLCDRLVTFGIIPQHPETGYGYISVERRSPLTVLTSSVLSRNRAIRKRKHT